MRVPKLHKFKDCEMNKDAGEACLFGKQAEVCYSYGKKYQLERQKRSLKDDYQVTFLHSCSERH